jgi:hypothetical protein
MVFLEFDRCKDKYNLLTSELVVKG